MEYNERMVTFLRSLDTAGEDWLEEIWKWAREHDVPIIRREMQSFLQLFLEMKKPAHILEVGAAVGYSALLMASFTGDDTRITTIENYEPRLVRARENIAASPYSSRIELIGGDAANVLKILLSERGEGYFDFVFMDAAKAQYIHFLPDVIRLLAPEGILISDNVLQDGVILESHYAVERRDRTIYKRMRDYLYTLKHTEGLVTSIVPIGDGASVTLKRS